MNTLQVRNSLFTNGTIEYLARSYEIGNMITGDFLTRGLNDTYTVQSENDKYIFRIYREGWRTKEDILYECDALNHLKESGISVSVPVKKKDGEMLTEIHAPEGIRYGVLFTFTKGDRPEITKENSFLIGKALGRIHQETDSFQSFHKRSFELNLDHLLHEPLALITPALDQHVAEYNILNEAAAVIKEDLMAHPLLDYGFCHGDFHNFNMHVNDQQIEAFDFDCCSSGYRAYDVAVFLWNLKQNYPSLENSMWDEVLNGYLSQKNMSSEDMKLLNKFVTLRRIWFMGTLLKNDDVWGTHWINQKNLESFLVQIKKDVESY